MARVTRTGQEKKMFLGKARGNFFESGKIDDLKKSQGKLK